MSRIAASSSTISMCALILFYFVIVLAQRTRVDRVTVFYDRLLDLQPERLTQH